MNTTQEVAKYVGHERMKTLAPAVRRATQDRIAAPGTDEATALRLVGRLIELDAYIDGEAEPDDR